MAYAQDKGNTAERLVLNYLGALGLPLARPRTTSVVGADQGDIHGLPFAVSVKNHKAIDLAGFVDELEVIVQRSDYPTGIVVAKRRGRLHPADWYVLTSGRLAMVLLERYVCSLPHPER